MQHRIGVLLSGRGSNFEALADSIAAGRIPGAEIVIVVSNRDDAPGLARAAARGIPARSIPSKGLARENYDSLLVAELQRAGVELVCLAGFMSLLSPKFIAAFPQRILNIHPSLLPSFPGLEAQRQALEYGVKFSGCTVHLVDENLDADRSWCKPSYPSWMMTRTKRSPCASLRWSTAYIQKRCA